MISLPVLSTQYVQIPITAAIDGAAYNPTGDEVQFAFIPGVANPGSGDWHTGSWASGTAPYLAQILIGPAGGVALPAGQYRIWVKITDNPETPVLQPDTLLIT